MGAQYYLYVSDAKVEMLAGQLRRGAAEILSGWTVDVNLGVVGAGVAGRSVPASRYKEIERIKRHVLTREDCGTIDDPGAYVIDSLPVRWGPFTADTDITFFTGATSRTVFALGGSTAWLIQAPPRAAGAYPHGGSATGLLISALLHEFGRTDRPDYEPAAAHYPGAVSDAVTALADEYAHNPACPLTEVEFLAKRLVVGPQFRDLRFPVEDVFEAPDQVFLGTPLYVAMTS
jgi:hypothetical protein